VRDDGAVTTHDIDAIHRARLEAFVLRARRIAAHSMAQDLDELRRLAGAEVHFGFDGTAHYFEQKLPPEETTESAAARVRPLLLQGDDCYYANVLAALGYFLRDHSERGNVREALRAWRARVDEPKVPTDAGYIVQIKDESTGEEGSMRDLQLALAWIYGDVVHHDSDRRAGARVFGVEERYRAAVPLVAFVMLSAVRLLGAVRSFQERQLISLDDVVFTEEVVALETTFRVRATAFVAEVGTPPPSSINAQWPGGWRKLNGPGSAEGLATSRVMPDDSVAAEAGQPPLGT
jgi:hypothetical protein